MADEESVDRADGASMPAEDASQHELAERERTDREAFGQLYEENYSRILNYLYRRTLNIDIAEELTSGTFLKAVRALPKLRDRASFRPWLYRIATNELKMHYRSEGRRRAAERESHWQRGLDRIHFSAEMPEAVQERGERMHQFARLRQSLARLPQRYETVLVLRYFEGLPHDEIAEVLGKRPSTVRSLVHRGLNRLRRLMCEGDATFP